MLASVPGNSATVDDALAITGGNPARTMAGKLTNEPPPAMAFIAPASSPAAAAARGAACCIRDRSRRHLTDATGNGSAIGDLMLLADAGAG